MRDGKDDSISWEPFLFATAASFQTTQRQRLSDAPETNQLHAPQRPRATLEPEESEVVHEIEGKPSS